MLLCVSFNILLVKKKLNMFVVYVCRAQAPVTEHSTWAILCAMVGGEGGQGPV